MDKTKLAEQLLKDWANLLKEYSADWQGSQVPEKLKKAFSILHHIFVLGESIRETAKIVGAHHSTIQEVYVGRYISAYEKYFLLGSIPEGVNILKEAFGDRKPGRPRKDYEGLARQLKEGNPLLWDRLIKALSTYRVRGKDGKPIFVSFEKIRKQLGEEIETFLGERVNQKTLWGKFIEAVVKVEWGTWWKFYAGVLDYRTYMQFIASKRAKSRKLPESLGFGWEWEIDITEVKVDGRHFYLLAVLDTFTRRFLNYALKEKEPHKSYNQAFDKYDVGAFLRELFEAYGAPRGLKMDNGKNFLAEYVQDALDYLGVEVFFSRPYAGWQKRIERAFGELKDWLLTPEVVELGGAENKIAKAFELYNKDKKEPKEVSKEFVYTTKVSEDSLAFAFYEKYLRKPANGYVSVAGVPFFVGHLLEEIVPSLRRGRRKENPEILVAIDPHDLTKVWVYVPSAEEEYEWEDAKWKFVGVAYADSALPADERTLTGKAKKTRKKRALKQKATKLVKELNKVQKEYFEEQQKPKLDEYDKFLKKEVKQEKETQRVEIKLPRFTGPGDVALWVERNLGQIDALTYRDKVRLYRILEAHINSMPASKRDFALQALKKLEKEVKAHA